MPFSRQRHWTLWLMSLLIVIFLAGLVFMMTQADLIIFYKTVPLGTKMLFLLPWIIGALALTLPLVLIALWRNQAPAPAWLLYGLNTAVTAAFLWFVTFWNLYQL
jgi:hypothetical protein